MIHFYCLECGMKFQVNDEFAGRNTKCPTCKQPLKVPDLNQTEASLPVESIAAAVSVGTVAPDRAGSLASVTVGYQPNEDAPVSELLGKNTADGRYLIDKEIARGGMGAVLRGIDRDIRREVAVKFMLDERDARKKARFVEEAQITGQLEHPNIVPVHELGIDAEKRPFFTMKMVRGRSLAQIMDTLEKDPRAERQWSLSRLLNILVNVCHALGYAHARQVIHRDLKPANIMIGDFGEVYVMDWGLAKVLSAPSQADAARPHPRAAIPVGQPLSADGASVSSKISTSRDAESELTQEGAILGTPAYMPPEQARGQIAAIDQRSDIYSLGAILYALLTLQPPVDKGGGQIAVLMRVVEGEIKRPEERTPQRFIPPELSAIAMKALAKEPGNRYQTVDFFRRDLELYLEGHSVSAKQDTLKEHVVKFVKRNKGLSAGLGIALLVLLVSLGFLIRSWIETNRAYTAYQKEQQQKEARTRTAVPALVESARLATEQQRFEPALKQLSIALEYDPESADALLLKGQLLIVQQKFAAAGAELDRYLAIRRTDEAADRLRTLCKDARQEDVSRLIQVAAVFNQQGAHSLVDGLLRQYGKTSNDARLVLLKIYQDRIQRSWPRFSLGQLTIDTEGMHLHTTRFVELTDLSPLKGMPLVSLSLIDCRPFTDLSPLKNMPLTSLNLAGSHQVRDLTPLQGMELTSLVLSAGPQDLTPLHGMPLQELILTSNTRVRDLTPLQGCPLKKLSLQGCDAVRDLTPLEGMPLKTLWLAGSGVKDLTPLKGMSLTEISFSPKNITTGLEVLRDMLNLKKIIVSVRAGSYVEMPAAEFWKRYEAGEYRK